MNDALDIEPEANVHTFTFADDGRVTPFSRIFGVAPKNSRVEIDGPVLQVTFGPWHVSTPLSNIEDVQVEGPYHWAKVAGPARYSLRDQSLTFATTTRKGAAITFKERIRGLDPLGVYRHPSLTVTVEDPEGFAEALSDACHNLDEIERAEHDHLEGMTAAQLRAVARAHDVEGVGSMKKEELVEVLSSLEDRD